MRRPDFRTTLGVVACAVYVWRVQDPKGSYVAFYDATDWLTTAVSSLFVADGALTGFLRNAINLILVDQVDGFLIGIVFVSLLAAILWPFKAGAQLAVRKVKSLRHRSQPASDFYPGEAPLTLTQIITPRPEGSSRPGSSAQN